MILSVAIVQGNSRSLPIRSKLPRQRCARDSHKLCGFFAVAEKVADREIALCEYDFYLLGFSTDSLILLETYPSQIENANPERRSNTVARFR